MNIQHQRNHHRRRVLAATAWCALGVALFGVALAYVSANLVFSDSPTRSGPLLDRNLLLVIALPATVVAVGIWIVLLSVRQSD